MFKAIISTSRLTQTCRWPHQILRSRFSSPADDGKQMAGLALFGSLVCGTFGLGVWQAQRYNWKVGLVKERQLLLAADPVELSQSTPRYQRVLVTGQLDPERELKVGPRSAPAGLIDRPQGLSSGPVGYEIVSVLKLDDGSEVMLNRGWAPKNADYETPREAIRLVALVEPGESKGTFSPVNTPKNVLWIETSFIASLLGCPADAIFLVRLADDDKDAPMQYPIARRAEHFQEFQVQPETHVGYAFTWFAMSLAGALMTRRLLRRPQAHKSTVGPSLRKPPSA